MEILNLFKENKIATITGIVASVLLLVLAFTSTKSEPLDFTPKMIKHTVQNVPMWAETIGSQKQTKISIPFSFDNEPIDLWLNYQTEEGVGVFNEFLMFHPDLQTLTWPIITNGEWYLYQKEPQYESISEFLDNPSGKVYADTQIFLEYPQYNFEPIRRELDLDNYDYVLTTFIPVPQKYGTFYYERVIDTSDAYKDEDDKIYWLVHAPGADEEHPFNLGSINIEYLQ